MIQEIDLPVTDLPFEAGKRFSAIVENGVAHITVLSRTEPTDPPTQKEGSAFLAKWAGSLDSSIKPEKHQDDPRMLSYIEKYDL